MSNRSLISAIALCGLVLGGCEKERANEVAGPDPAQPQVAEPEAEAEPEQASEADLQVLPAVTVVAVELDCAETDVYFPTGSAELSDEDRAVLDSVAACLKATPEQEKIEIVGRADPRGPEPYNEKLSRERAKTVADYLQKQGVSPDSFQIRARGEKGAVEDIPLLWPAQREAEVRPQPPAK